MSARFSAPTSLAHRRRRRSSLNNLFDHLPLTGRLLGELGVPCDIGRWVSHPRVLPVVISLDDRNKSISSCVIVEIPVPAICTLPKRANSSMRTGMSGGGDSPPPDIQILVCRCPSGHPSLRRVTLGFVDGLRVRRRLRLWLRLRQVTALVTGRF